MFFFLAILKIFKSECPSNANSIQLKIQNLGLVQGWVFVWEKVALFEDYQTLWIYALTNLSSIFFLIRKSFGIFESVTENILLNYLKFNQKCFNQYNIKLFAHTTEFISIVQKMAMYVLTLSSLGHACISNRWRSG